MNNEKLLQTAELLVNAMKIIYDDVPKDEEVYGLYKNIFNSIQIIGEITGEHGKIKEMTNDKLGAVKAIA